MSASRKCLSRCLYTLRQNPRWFHSTSYYPLSRFIRNSQADQGGPGFDIGREGELRLIGLRSVKCHSYLHRHPRTMKSLATSPTSTDTPAVSSAQLLWCVKVVTLIPTWPDTRPIHPIGGPGSLGSPRYPLSRLQATKGVTETPMEHLAVRRC